MSKPTSDCHATERKHLWPMVRLGDVCEVRAGANYKDVEDPNGRYPIYGTGGIMGRASQYRCPAHSVIVGRKGTLDNPFLVHEPFWNIDTCFGVVPSERIIPEYLFRFCQGFDFYSLVPASGRPSTTSDAVRAIEIPLPPLPVQREIVARLERELAAVEKMKKGFEALAETAKAEFKAELEETFLHLKSKLMLFGDACEFIRNGASIKQGKGMSGIPVTRIETLAGGRINPDRVGYANIYDPHLYNKYLLSEGDLLISHINSERYIGRMVMYRGEIEGPIIHGMNLLRARLLCSASVLPDYVELYFKTTAARKYILSVIKKAVNQVSVSATDFKNMPLSVPTMELQRQIVSHLSAAKARAEKLEAKAREGAAVCETMRKAILKEAFEGK